VRRRQVVEQCLQIRDRLGLGDLCAAFAVLVEIQATGGKMLAQGLERGVAFDVADPDP